MHLMNELKLTKAYILHLLVSKAATDFSDLWVIGKPM